MKRHKYVEIMRAHTRLHPSACPAPSEYVCDVCDICNDFVQSATRHCPCSEFGTQEAITRAIHALELYDESKHPWQAMMRANYSAITFAIDLTHLAPPPARACIWFLIGDVTFPLNITLTSIMLTRLRFAFNTNILTASTLIGREAIVYHNGNKLTRINSEVFDA